MELLKAFPIAWRKSSNSLLLVTESGELIGIDEEHFSRFQKLASNGIPYEYFWLASQNITVAKLDSGIYSRKAVMESVIANLEVGNIFEAKIVSVKPASAFLEYDGVYFHLERKEISTSYIKSVEEYFTVGQVVSVMLLNKGDASHYPEVSYKRAFPDSLQNYSSGDFVKFKVTNFSQEVNGFFGEISPAVSGIMDVEKVPDGTLPLEYGDVLLCKVKNVSSKGLRLYGVSLLSRR